MVEPVVDVASGLPAPALHGLVAGYTGYRMEGFGAGVHRGMPSRHLTFIVSLGERVEIAALPDPAQPATAETAFVSGYCEGAATILHDGNRHLGERFRDEIGVSPKTAARIVRFERAKNLLSESARPGLAEVAATTGYYDQAHFNRDWRALAGCSPTEWLAEELPSVQDAGVLDRSA